MNVTVHVPSTLRLAVEGRMRLELGVPASADVADVVETLLALYPKLGQHVVSDRATSRPGVQLFLSESALLDLARRRTGLKEGQRLYLSAAQPRAQRT